MPVTVYAALLRGINVSGKNKLPMADLRALFESLGHADVVTYIQSGNVVFASTTARAKIPGEIADAIAHELGLTVPVIIRSRKELQQVAAGNPYLKVATAPSQLHVTFLADAPTKAKIASLDPDRSAPDEFTVAGKEIYLLLRNGMGRTKLGVDYFEPRLATRATARNWNTVNKLVDLMDG